MLNLDRNIKITWKDFEFPLSIKTFVIDESARVATYTYAGMDGALHERVMQYRVISMSGTFSSYSWESYGWLSPNDWISQLQRLNDNRAGILSHPIFWNYMCIIHDLKITHNWEDTEPDSNNKPIPNFDFEIEFWEHTHSWNNIDLNKFYPAIATKPPSDLYKTTLKYTTCDQMYSAIIDWVILPWEDPILNYERLQYDIGIRSCAYDRRVANPNGENNWTSFDKKGNIKANTKSKVSAGKWTALYTVRPDDTTMLIAVANGITPADLFEANRGRDVRDWYYYWLYPGVESVPWYRWTLTADIKAGDKLVIPEPKWIP